MHDNLTLDEFLSLPAERVAACLRASGTRVCVFPINGTRRWYILEHLDSPDQELGSEYVDIVARRHIELYKMLFDHGLDTLLTPVFGPDLLERGSEYLQLAAEGLGRLATHPEFVSFYTDYGVRVRFYGDYRRNLDGLDHTVLSDSFDQIAAQTQNNNLHRLFFGVFAHDPADSMAELTVRFYVEQGRVPDKSSLVTMYYGEPVGSVDIFIGFDKLCVFDMPLVATGNEDLYFTASPSLYLTERQLRTMLYDHLYARRDKDHDHKSMTAFQWAQMRAYYQANAESTLGIGIKQHPGGFWYPLPQIRLPEGFVEAISKVE